MKAKNFIPPSKPRNFVVKNQQTSGAGAHKDKKKAQKQGQVKHKGKEFSEAFPYDVDHMTGSQGINLPSAEPSDILDKPYEHYGNYKKWLQDVNRINRALLDDNADYISKPGAKIVSINREQFAIWSERNGNGHIDVRVAKNHSQLQDDFSEDCDQVCEECSRPVCNTVGVREYLERRLSKKIKEHIERLSAEHARPNKSKK